MAARWAVGLACVLALSGCAASAPSLSPVGHAEFQFTGDWSGTLDTHGEGVTGMVIASAAVDGTQFEGDITFSAGGVSSTESIGATMTPHGHLVAGIGSDASIEMHITDPTTLDYCFIRYGTDSVYSCGRLVRGS